MSLLTIDDGIIKLDSNLIDAVFISCNPTVALRYDEESEDSTSGSVKRPIGFKDAEITVELLLLTDDNLSCYDRLNKINKLFKSTKNGAIRRYNINNKHLLARGVRSVLFEELSSTESNEDDTIKVVLKFKEFIQPAARNESAKPKEAKAVNKPNPFVDMYYKSYNEAIKKKG